MAKKKIVKPQREYTKRQLSRWQRQKRTQRITIGSGILIVAAVLGIILAGWYINDYGPLHQTVIRVNDTKYNMDYYVKALRFYGSGMSGSYLQFIVDDVVTVVQQNELVRQEAFLKLDISVSKDALDEELKNLDNPPSNDLKDVYRDAVRADLLMSKLLDEHFEQQIAVSAEQRHILAMFLESESLAADVRSKLETGEDFADYAGELSLERLSKDNSGDLGWRPKEVLPIILGTSVPGDYAFNAEAGALSQPLYDEEQTKNVGYWLINVLEKNKEEEKSHIQAILLGSEEEARTVRARLETGEDFAELAEELSQHSLSKEEGGDLGELTPGEMSPAFDAYAFDPELEVGTLSDPVRDDTVQTKGGYWLVKVIEIDNNRTIDDDDRDLLKRKELNDWEVALGDDPNNIVESYLDDETKFWAILRAVSN